ncbi:hypothetical protein NL676_026665 [Syzygium grande]|nr:hypothetical protein NL676_026665 [Syzygium grande]
MDYGSEEDSDISDSEMLDDLDRPCNELRSGKFKVKGPHGSLRCPFCTGKKRTMPNMLQRWVKVLRIEVANERQTTCLGEVPGDRTSQPGRPSCSTGCSTTRCRNASARCVIVCPWTGVMANILVDKSSDKDKELVDSADWRAKFAKYKPLEVHMFWNEDGRSAKAVVRFNHDWHGFINVTGSEKEFETENHGKKGWNGHRMEPGSSTYGWCARQVTMMRMGQWEITFTRRGSCGQSLTMFMKQLKVRHRIVAHLANKIDLTNETLEELYSPRIIRFCH